MSAGIQISWEAVAALSGVLVGVGGLQALYVRLAIKSCIADWVKELNGRYRNTEVCDALHHDIDRRLGTLEEK